MKKKGEIFEAECKRGLPGWRSPYLELGKKYKFRVDKFEYYFSIFNHTKILVYWIFDSEEDFKNGVNSKGTYFGRIDFRTFFHPTEKLEDFLLHLKLKCG
jgi:hypothetical protein